MGQELRHEGKDDGFREYGRALKTQMWGTRLVEWYLGSHHPEQRKSKEDWFQLPKRRFPDRVGA